MTAAFSRVNSVQERADLCGRGRIGQSFVRNRADDLMSKRAVRLRHNCESDRKKNQSEQSAPKPEFHFQKGDDTIESCLSQKVPARLSAQPPEFQRIFSRRSLEFREVRSGPINLAAAGATPELLVVDFSKRLELSIISALETFAAARCSEGIG